MTYQLSQPQLQVVQNLFDQNEYAAAYQYVHDSLSDAVGAGLVTSQVQSWFGYASQINADSGSYSSEYVRSYTKNAGLLKGITITDQDFQDASDDLAQLVLHNLLSSGGEIPESKQIIEEEVQSIVVDGLELKNEDWAGTLSGQFFFGVDTLKDYVFGDTPAPQEFLTFLKVFGNTAVSMVMPFMSKFLPDVVDTQNGVKEMEIGNSTVYANGDYIYRETPDGTGVVGNGINAWYGDDGSQHLEYQDVDTGTTYYLVKNADGSHEMYVVDENVQATSFELYHQADPVFREALNTLYDKVNEAVPDGELAQFFTDAGVTSAGELFIPIPGHKPDVDTGESDTPTNTAVDQDDIPYADSFDGTTGGGPRLQTFGTAGSDYSNANLFTLLNSSAAETRFKAFGDLYERALAYDDITQPNGVTIANIEGGGFFLVTSDGKIALFAAGADPFQDSPIGMLVGTTMANGEAAHVLSVGTAQQILIEDSALGKLAITDFKIADDYFASMQGVVGDYIADYISDKLSDGNVVEQILYSSALKAVSQNLDVFTGMIADGISAIEALGAFTGETVINPNTNQAYLNEDILTDGFTKLVGVTQTTIIGFLANEVSEALDIDGALGIEGTIGGDIFNIVEGTITTGIVNAAVGSLDDLSFLFKGIDGGVYSNLLNGSMNFSTPIFNSNFVDPDFIGPPNPAVPNTTVGEVVGLQIANALAGYAGGQLAGALVQPEGEMAAIFGAAGSAIAGAIASGAILAGNGLATAFSSIGWAGGPLGAAVGAFIGTVAGTLLGNAIGGGQDTVVSWATAAYNAETGEYGVANNWGSGGGDPAIANSLAQSVLDGVNSIIESTGGKLRSGAAAPVLEIGMKDGEYIVSVGGGATQSYSSANNMVMQAAFQVLKGFDLVGGHAVVMRAWHNSDANNIHEFKEDMQVAEAFQNYLADPTGILALMMDQPESDLAQSWASVLQRAAELELHLPHEKDLDGGWAESLLAQGVDPEDIPDIDGDTITITDPVTGEETVLHHIIGPGYEIVRIEGTDGNDIIEVIVDGPSITYVDAGAGDDTVVGSEQADVIVGGTGDDTIDGLGGNDWLHGGEGEDTIDGGAGDDLVVGGFDDDTLNGGDDSDQVYGSYGNDIMYGDAGQDFLYGGAGDDVIYGQQGESDYLYGGDGDDILVAQDFNYLDGGAGNDTFDISSSNGNSIIQITRGEGHDTVIGHTQGDNSRIEFDQTISTNELFFKQSGDDLQILILGEDQSVTIQDFFLSIGPKLRIYTYNLSYVIDDISSVLAVDQQYVSNIDLTENILSDTILSAREQAYSFETVWNYQFSGTPAWGVVNGTDQADTINPLNTAGVRGGAGDDVLNSKDYTSIEHEYFYGDSGDDIINAGYGSDTMIGGLGDDDLYGSRGNDRVYGGQGNDYIKGDEGNDKLYGGTGDDIIYTGIGNDVVEGGAGNDTIYLEQGYNVVYGNEGNDTVYGGLDDDIIYGNEGNDTITGDEASDSIFGGAGDDNLDGGLGDDMLQGDEGNDTIRSLDGSDVVYGGEGDDIILSSYRAGEHQEYYGGAGNDTLEFYLSSAEFNNAALILSLYSLHTFIQANQQSLIFEELTFTSIYAPVTIAGIEEVLVYNDGVLASDLFSTITFGQDLEGSDEDDDFYGSDLSDVMAGLAGDDYFESYAGDDALNGGAGNDIIVAGLGNDSVEGGDDDDTLYGDEGNDLLYGDGGNDIIYAGIGDDLLDGGAGDDTLKGGEGDDILIGGAGDDTITAGLGNDTLNGGAGDDTLDGNAGDDLYIISSGQDTITDAGGVDTISFSAAGYELDYFTFSRSGDDLLLTHRDGSVTTIVNQYAGNTIEFLQLNEHFSIDLTDWENWIWQDQSNTNYQDGSNDSILIGDDSHASISGNNGNDIIFGGFGEDRLYGGYHNDILIASSAGRDVIHGEHHDDIIYGSHDNWLYGDDGDDLFILSTVNEFIIEGGAGNDTVSFEYIAVDNISSINLTNERIYLDDNSEVLMTNMWNIIGSQYDDTIIGNSNDNVLQGGAGNDTITAGAGNDTLYGNDGFDQLFGGAGADTFVFESSSAFNDIDEIADFNKSEGDVIDIRSLLVGRFNSSLQSLNDFVRFIENGNDTLLQVDFDGGANNFETVALLNGSGGLILPDLIRNEQLLVSDSEGFAPILAMDMPVQIFNAGQYLQIDLSDYVFADLDSGAVEYEVLWQGLLDEQTHSVIQPAINNDLPNWLNFNDEKLILSGVIPIELTSDVQLQLSATYGETDISTDFIVQFVNNDVEAENQVSFVDFNDSSFDSYGSQDVDGNVVVSASGDQVDFAGNTWQQTSLSYTVTQNTIIEFDFKSTVEGELQGFVLETDSNFQTGSNVIQLYGTDNDSYFDTSYQYTSLGDWQHFVIDVSDYVIGEITSLAFVNDDDRSPQNSNSSYRGFAIYDAVSIVGTNSQDILQGNDSADILYAGADNDILYGNDGFDQLFGEAGADTFVFGRETAFNDVDEIKDFSESEGDVIDIADLLTAYDPLNDAIADFVTFTESGGDTIISVDQDGTGTSYSAQNVVTIDNVTGLDISDLISNNQLIVV